MRTRTSSRQIDDVINYMRSIKAVTADVLNHNNHQLQARLS